MKTYKGILPQITLKYKKGDQKKVQIQCSKDVYQLCGELFDKDLVDYSEEFLLILLNRANNTIGWVKISSGGISGTVCDPKVVFTYALNAGASSIILAHNHPSGNTKPSQCDINITKKIKGGGELLDIKLLDHIIYTTENGHYSFLDEGLI